MSGWSKRILVAAMVVWSALTAFAGFVAVRGGQPRALAATAVTYDVASPDTTRQVHYLVGEPARNVLSALNATTPTAAATRGPSLRPPPQYAAPTGASPRIRSIETGAPSGSSAATRPSAKGVIVLDPGHGRGDPGAVHYLSDGSGRWDITEAASNQRNAALLKEQLESLGYEVYLTRDGEGRGPAAPLPLQFITSDLYARVGLARAVDADLYLAIHGNGATVHSISGPETWYCGKHQDGAANEQLAAAVQRAMMDALHEYGYFPPDRGIKEDAEAHHSGDFCQFVVTRETPTPAALVEFLFLTNDEDARVLLDDRAHVLMARHVAEAIDAFMRRRGG
jgi:N-acetylmuramoyl-L-alanine amidase